jgi:hypothetical protein
MVVKFRNTIFRLPPIENGVYRRWIYILADVLAMDNLHVGAAPRLFCGFFLK